MNLRFATGWLILTALLSLASCAGTGPVSNVSISIASFTIDGESQNILLVAPKSPGAPAAMAGAATLPPKTVAGAVISSPVSVPGLRDSVFDVALAQVSVPVLIQIHQDDSCLLTPPINAARIKAALTSAPVAEIQTF